MNRGVTLMLLATVLAPPAARAYPNGAPPGRTGAPGEMTCADRLNRCHDSTLNDPAGEVTLALADAGTGSPLAAYAPGQPYTLLVSISSGRADRLAWGFQMTSLDDAGAMAGGFPASIDPLYQDIDDILHGRRDVTHTLAGRAFGVTTGNSWRVRWDAPPTDAGPITFYVCGNAANGNGINTGDYIRCTTFRAFAAGSALELQSDARVTSLSGGAPACGPATLPEEATILLTPCSSPQRTGCSPQFAVPPTQVRSLVPGAPGPDLTLTGEALPDVEPGVLTFYELKGCSVSLRISKAGPDILVDAL